MLVFARLDVLLNSLQLLLLQVKTPLPEQMQQAELLLTEAEELTKQLSSDLLERIILIRQTDALQVFIQNVQTSCTVVANKVYEHSVQLEEKKLQELEPYIRQYKQLLSGTSELLQFIELHFPFYFNREQSAPFYYQELYKEQLQKSFKQLKPLLEKMFGKQFLVGCCIEHLKGYLHNRGAGSYSYTMIEYLDKLCIALKASTELSSKGNYSGLECCLLLMNFNHDDVLCYFINKLDREAPHGEATSTIQQYWYVQQKILLQLTNAPGVGLYTEKKSLVQVLMQLTEDELYHLHQNEINKYGNNDNRLKTAKGLRLNLPVAQIAILLRLMVEAGLIKVPNHTAFLKDMALLIQTERAGTISADSLRNKYYTPEQTSIEAIKDVLFVMIKNSHKLRA